MSSTKTDQFAPIDYRAQLHASQERERGLVAELERQAKEKRAWNIDANNLRADLAKAQAESEAAAKRWDEENASLAAQLAKAQARRAELEAFAERVNGYLLRRYPHDHDCGVKFASSCDCDSNRERVVLLEVLPERDGNSALAAVRLAQRLTRLLRRGGNLYDLPEQVEKALDEAFGGGE